MIQFQLIPKQLEIALQYLAQGLKADFNHAKILVLISALTLPFLITLLRFASRKLGLAKSIFHLMMGFLLSITAYTIFSLNPQNGVYIVLKYIVVLWVFFEMMRALAESLNGATWLRLLAAFFFLLLAFIMFAFIDLVALYAEALFERYRSLYLLTRNIAKGTSTLAFIFFVYSFWPNFKTKVSQRWYRAWRHAMFWILALLLSISGLWIGGQIEFTLKTLIGLSFFSVLVAFWIYLYLNAYHVTHYIYRRVDLEIGETIALTKHFVRLAFLVFIYSYYRFVNNFLNVNLDAWFEKIKIIESRVYTLTLADLLWGLYVFAALFSLLMLGAKFLRQLNGGKAIEDLLENLGFLIVFIITLIILRIPWQVIAAVGGALSVGIGIGSSALISNYFASLVLLFSNRLKIGDIVEIQGEIGKALGGEESIFGWVKDIGAWSTTIRSFDHFDVYVPNIAIVADKMVNYSAAGHWVRTHFQIEMPCHEGIGDTQMRELIQKSLENLEKSKRQRFRESAVFLIHATKEQVTYRISLAIDARILGNFREFQDTVRGHILAAMEKLIKEPCYNSQTFSNTPEKPND